MATLTYEGHPKLIKGVAAISERALARKPDRVMFRIRKGQVIDVSDTGSAAQIGDLACRISNITAELFRHQGRLVGVFANPL
jgi:hypothetical protein